MMTLLALLSQSGGPPLACAQLGMKECIVSKAQKVVRANTTVMLSAKQCKLAVSMLRIDNVSC